MRIDLPAESRPSWDVELGGGPRVAFLGFPLKCSREAPEKEDSFVSAGFGFEQATID